MSGCAPVPRRPINQFVVFQEFVGLDHPRITKVADTLGDDSYRLG
jgi:hypothetical protein